MNKIFVQTITGFIRKRAKLLAIVPAVAVLSLAVITPAFATPGGYQTSTSTAALGASSRAITVPTGTAAGDILVTQVVTNHNDLTGTSAPAGWTLACSQGGIGVAQGIWWRVATSSEPGSYTWTLPADSGVVGNMIRYSGVDTTTPIDSCSGQASSTAGTAMTAPSVTINTGDELMVTAYGFTNAGTVTPPSGYTERTDAKTSKDPLGRAVSSEIADQASGTCGTATCTISAATATAAMLSGEPTPQWVALQYSLIPSVPQAPVNTAVPTISGLTQTGATLTASPGTWLSYGSTPSYTYQWQNCSPSCTNISGATSSTYVLTTGDLGDRIKVAVTATNAGGSTAAVSGLTRYIGYLYDNFSGSNGVIINEYAFWNPSDPSSPVSTNWEMDSGCLFRYANAGTTQTPDTNSGSPTATCSPYNNNNIFRLNTKATFSGDTSIYLDLKQNTDIHDSNCNSTGTCWYGTHVWTRYQSQYDLYYASLNRADGNVVLKRKVPCGSDNGGTYFTLGSGFVSGHDWTVGTTKQYQLTTVDNVDGSVTLSLYDLGYSTVTPIVTGTDSGGTNANWSSGCTTPGKYSSATYTPLTGSGKAGVRGDYANMTIDNFSVIPY